MYRKNTNVDKELTYRSYKGLLFFTKLARRFYVCKSVIFIQLN